MPFYLLSGMRECELGSHPRRLLAEIGKGRKREPLGLRFGCCCCQEGHDECEALLQEWFRCDHGPPRVGERHGHPGLGSVFRHHLFEGWGQEHRSVRVHSSEQEELVSL